MVDIFVIVDGFRLDLVFVYLGDKSFLFIFECDVFLMYVLFGGGLIFMGGLVGLKVKWWLLLVMF